MNSRSFHISLDNE